MLATAYPAVTSRRAGVGYLRPGCPWNHSTIGWSAAAAAEAGRYRSSRSDRPPTRPYSRSRCRVDASAAGDRAGGCCAAASSSERALTRSGMANRPTRIAKRWQGAPARRTSFRIPATRCNRPGRATPRRDSVRAQEHARGRPDSSGNLWRINELQLRSSDRGRTCRLWREPTAPGDRLLHPLRVSRSTYAPPSAQEFTA